ncbi:MAG: beta galactosidase jelly roll domain-containing protein [Kiritimatiellae bacterium]|nr:beta galactosidase jelly roll domain-containing protein [Kiritimatiellia bacterium]
MTNNKNNAVQVLAGSWRILADPDNTGKNARWFNAVPGKAQPTPVPGIIQQVFPDYFGVAWYWYRFKANISAGRHDRVLLRFGAVDYLAEVWLNGRLVGGHEGGETPFSLDVTTAIARDRENLLAVRVLNPTNDRIDGIVLRETPHRHKTIPFCPGRAYNLGGILLPVELLVVPAVHITGIFTVPDLGSSVIHVTVTVRNDTGRTSGGRLDVSIAPDKTDNVLVSAALGAHWSCGESTQVLTLPVAQPRRWDLDDPYLYRIHVKLAAGGIAAGRCHNQSVRCGFRDFRVEDGWFKLNGRRLFLKSTHTGNHFPIGQIVPHNPDFMRRDLIYAKACGFNTVRFIAGMAWPEQLDFCDEIGLMVYEETMAAWCLDNSPRMAKRYDRSIREMILRDRNHPSVTIWGLLNETPDGPVFRHAVKALKLVRDLDTTRLVLLNSGRWDCQPMIGSMSNPGSHKWEYQWGVEGRRVKPVFADASTTIPSIAWDKNAGAYFQGAGDAHVYPGVPQVAAMNAFIRHLGYGTKPVFLSEYGIGSLMNVIDEYHKYEETGCRLDGPDAALSNPWLTGCRPIGNVMVSVASIPLPLTCSGIASACTSGNGGWDSTWSVPTRVCADLT